MASPPERLIRETKFNYKFIWSVGGWVLRFGLNRFLMAPLSRNHSTPRRPPGLVISVELSSGRRSAAQRSAVQP